MSPFSAFKKEIRVLNRLEDVFAVETCKVSYRLTCSDPDVEINWYMVNSGPGGTKATRLRSVGNYSILHNGEEHQLIIHSVSRRHEGYIHVRASGERKLLDKAQLVVTGVYGAIRVYRANGRINIILCWRRI